MDLRKKKILSTLLMLAILIGMMPGVTFAEGETAPYVVIHWVQNANDDGYDQYVAKEEKTGYVGALTEAEFLSSSDSRIANCTPHGTIEQKTIVAINDDNDDPTIVNVYYDRNVYTLTMHYGSNRKTTGTITARWGANVSTQWENYCTTAKCHIWSEVENSSTYTEYVDIMPAENRDYYANEDGSSSAKYCYYYVENLSGSGYDLKKTVTFYTSGLSITDEDKIPIEGFTYKTYKAYWYGWLTGTKYEGGSSLSDAEFYYTRNSYSVHYYIQNTSGDYIDAVTPVTKKYEASLTDCEITAPAKDGYKFVGWYLDQYGQKAFDFNSTMPAHDLLLYARYEKVAITVTGTSYEGVYDGKAHGVAAIADIKGATVYYSTDGGSNWSTTVPTITNVGSVTVNVKATKSGYKTGTCVYTLTVKKSSSLTLDTSNAGCSVTYDAKSHGSAVVPSVSSGTTVSYSTDGGKTWTTTPPTRTDAGTTSVMVKAENPNYETATGNYTLAVYQKAVTVKANNKSRKYGESNPAFDATVTGLIGSDAVSYTVNCNAQTTSNAGSYVISCTGDASQGNYTVTYEAGTLTVNKAGKENLTIDVSNAGGTFTYDGNKHGSYATCNNKEANLFYSIDGGTTWTTTYPTRIDAGTTQVKVKAVHQNYEDATYVYNIVVNPKAITIKAHDKTRKYGESNPEFTSYTKEGGLVGNDTIKFTYSCTASSTSAPGTYRIDINGDTNQGNYTVTFEAGTLTVTKGTGKTIDVSGAAYEGTYDGKAHGGSAKADSTATLYYSTDSGKTWSKTAPTRTDAGTDTVLVKAESNYYEYEQTSYAIRVNRKAVTVTAANASRKYGENNPTFSASVTGTIGTDSVKYSLSTTANKNSVIGTYPISATGDAEQGNYKVTFVPGTLTITKASGMNVVISGAGCDTTYDGLPHGGTASADKTGATIEYSTDGGTTWTKVAPTRTEAGQTNVKVRATHDQYETAYGEYSLKIAKAEVTVTAVDKVKKYGEENPEFTATVAGVFNNDKIDYTFECTATKDSTVGEYRIGVTGAAEQKNYTVKYIAGKLTISKTGGINLDVSNCGCTVNYDAKAHGGKATADKGATVSYSTDNGKTWSTTAPTRTDAGTTTVKVKAEHSQYDTVEAEYKIVVNKIPVTVTAVSKSRSYGENNPSLTANTTGTLGSDKVDYTVSCKATTTSAVGVYDITVSGKADQGNYTVTFVNGTLTVTKAKGMSLNTANSGCNVTYDAQSHGAAVTADKSGATISYSIDGGKNWSTDYPTRTDAGVTTVLVKAEHDKYETVTAEYTLKVNKAAVTIKANDVSRKYGDKNPEFTAKVTGLVGNDTINYAVSTTATQTSDAGTYAINVTGDKNLTNYAVSFVPGTLTINKASGLTVDVTNAGSSGKYDGQPHGNAAKPNKTGTTVSYSTDGGKTWTTEVPTRTDAGTTNVMVKAENPNYNTVTSSYTITVSKRYVVLSSASANKVHDGKALTSKTVNVTGDGFVQGEGAAYTVSGTQTEIGESKNTFTYALNANTKDSNYTISTVTGTLTVTDTEKGVIEITIPDEKHEYTGKPQGDGVDSDDLPKGSTVEYSEDGGKTWTKTVPQITNVNEGPKTILVKVTNPDYITFESHYILEVTPKEVVVRANDISMEFGGTEPELTATVTGLVGNDTIKYELVRSTGSTVGEYTISATGDAKQGNYTVKYTSGKFSITESTKKNDDVYYKIVIHYETPEGETVIEDYISEIKAGEREIVVSPDVDGYEPSVKNLVVDGSSDTEVTVTYHKTGEDKSNDWGKTEENTIVIIDEEEVPLADGEDGICILHILIALLAFAVELYYINKKKKYQEDILGLQDSYLHTV